MYDRVLHPTDGSEGAEVATGHAIELARRFDAPLHAVFVVDVAAIQSTDAFATSNFEATVEALESEGRKRLDQVEERAGREGIEFTTELLKGTPAESIVEEARQGDVIVMGTHGRTGLDRYLIGSTTEKVVRATDVPVLTVPMTEVAGADEEP